MIKNLIQIQILQLFRLPNYESKLFDVTNKIRKIEFLYKKRLY